MICGTEGIRSAYATGRGLLTVRARADFEEGKRNTRIVVTEIPYMVNKSTLLERIAELVREGKIDGVTDLRDESNREGIRVVIELRRTRPRRCPQPALQADAAADDLRRQHAGAGERAPAAALRSRRRCATSSTSAARWWCAAPSTTSPRPRRAPTSSRASPIALDHLDEVIALIRAAEDAARPAPS